MRKNTELPLLLYVEDDEMNWNVASLRLGSHYRLLWAKDDVEACTALRNHGSELKAILMDIQLKSSALNGLELTRLFRGRPALTNPLPLYAQGLPKTEIPIFFITAAGHEYSEEKLMAEGGNGLIPKPVDFLRLSLALARALARDVMTGLEPKPRR